MLTTLEAAETLQNLLVALATQSSTSSADYVLLRKQFMADPALNGLLPRWVRTCRDPAQFWEFIKHKFKTYRERREFIYQEFRPLLEHLERSPSPADAAVHDTLKAFDEANVHAAWAKALERRETDPEGAITAARTLLEAVCKHILDDALVAYDDNLELPPLYKLTAKQLKLAPDQHTEEIFKQILGGCATVVSGLGALRNKVSDAHGRGRRPVKPAVRHAELAVNLAGAIAMFLVSTCASQKRAS